MGVDEVLLQRLVVGVMNARRYLADLLVVRGVLLSLVGDMLRNQCHA